MSELNKQAFPAAPNSWGDPVLGLTLRQHAAIAMRVPMSGDPELDAMIREARRLDMATAAMQGPGTASDNAEWALEAADALLAASEPKKTDPEKRGNYYGFVEPKKAERELWCEAHGAQRCEECVPQPNAEGWIEWSGGDCPVPDEARVEVRLRIGEIIGDIASEFMWGHEDDDFSDGDILAYRVVK
ncbi:MAG TPA: hypothetical protein VFH31_05275 [Pyrinomonadaceae bacterium]|nr:hypothetical protein [Pyrinomonadaceae bacterium]